MAREYFCAYHSYLKSVEPLNDAECGRLFRSCLEYSMTGAEPELRGNEKFVWPMIQQQIDRDREKYNAFCEKQRGNIQKRWDTTVYGGKSGIPDDTKHTKTKAKEKEKEISANADLPTHTLPAADVERLESLHVPDDAGETQRIVCEELRDMGFDVRTEHPVPDRGDGHGGRIDVLATRDGKLLAIEIDRESPREKSIYKLMQCEADEKLILLRDANGDSKEFPDCPISTLSLICKPEKDAFDTFWEMYPRKVAKEKARSAFQRLPKRYYSPLFAGLKAQKQSEQWCRDGGQFIPYPATWLNQRRWEDRPPEVSAASPRRGTPYAQHEVGDLSHLCVDLDGGGA